MIIFETERESGSIVRDSGIMQHESVFHYESDEIREERERKMRDFVEKNASQGICASPAPGAFDPSIMQLVMTLTPAVIASLTTLIVTLLNSKKEFSLKENGKEISLKGYSKKEINEILYQYMDSTSNKKDKLSQTQEPFQCTNE